MKDRLFSGTDVEDALAAAAASLGLPRAELRYVVLEPGRAGARGLSATPARIAVLIHDVSAPRPGRAADERQRQDTPREEPTGADVHAAVRALVRALAEAGDLALDCETEDTESALRVQLSGTDVGVLFGEDGNGEPLRALEHLLQRMHGEALRPRTLRLGAEGFRERRDQALAEQALAFAAEVRSSLEPRTLEPMNAYERRIVHVALQGEPDVRTFSVGEGASRRVTIAPAGAEVPPQAGAVPGDRDGR